jgi:nitrite reductase/ring-hydroxylating ferredoxin subunit
VVAIPGYSSGQNTCLSWIKVSEWMLTNFHQLHKSGECSGGPETKGGGSVTETAVHIDSGTGYGRPRPTHDARLTEVGPGTPMGEALRRYWHPIATSNALTSDVPHRSRILGEDLIVFRDGGGRAGVVFERCAHRGTSLFFGRVEEDGIRCCYHGFKFDTQGICLEQACEPERGRRKDAVRQPWYPVEERYGLVFVYMGPPDCKPPLPRYDLFEELDEGEAVFAELPIHGGEVTGLASEFNWLQIFENGMDPVHAMWLHYQHSGPQFVGIGTTGFPHTFFDPYALTGKIKFSKTERGVKYHQRFERPDEDGTLREMDWCIELQIPNILALPDFVEVRPDRRHDCLIFVVPVDDTSHRAFIMTRATDISRLMRLINGVTQNGKLFFELDPDEMQRYHQALRGEPGELGPWCRDAAQPAPANG